MIQKRAEICDKNKKLIVTYESHFGKCDIGLLARVSEITAHNVLFRLTAVLTLKGFVRPDSDTSRHHQITAASTNSCRNFFCYYLSFPFVVASTIALRISLCFRVTNVTVILDFSADSASTCLKCGKPFTPLQCVKDETKLTKYCQACKPFR